MDLAELKFVVDTKQLEDAAKKVAELGTAVSNLNKPMQNLTRESAKTNKELSKAEEAAAKAALAQTKLEQAQTKSTEATGKSVSVLERQNMILGFMATGLSKGQASYMATAKAAGALDAELEQLETTLKTQRSLIGGDAFDKSIGLMQKLSNETKITAEVNRLFNQSLALTEKQMIELAREKERLIALYNHEKRSLDGLDAEYQQIINKSVELNSLNDARTNGMRQQVKAQNDASRANEYLAKEMERVNRLNSEGADITSATNNRLIRFERELKASGASAAEAATKLNAYRNALLSAQKAAGNRQIDYLSRALGPQITDIAVGLATGQAPLTILLQQGGQLRDQFALAGVAGAQMGDMLVKATSSMVTSVKDVGVAIGSAFIGAINNSGKAITKFAMDITGANSVLENLRYQIALFEKGSSGPIMKTFLALGSAITFLTGVLLVTGIAALIAFGVALSDVIKEENALNRALNLTGAAMGLNLDMAYDAARGMEQFGVSTGTALEVLTEMAKIGGMSSKSLEMVATTAKAMKTAFDIPIAETVKQFKELQEKPTESLTKLAVKLGTIPVEILKQVDAYERAGNTIKAAELATKTYADAGKDAADRTVENFGIITTLGIKLGNIWNATWESIMGIGRKDTASDQLRKAEENLKFLQTRQGADDLSSPTGRRVLATMGLIDDLKNQIAAEKELAEQRKKQSEDADKFAADKKKRDEEAKKSIDDAKKAQESFATALETANKFYQNQVGAVNDLTKSEIALNKVKEETDYKKFSPEQKKQIDAIYEQASANEKLVKAEKDRTAQMNAIAALMGKSDGFGKQYYDTLKLIDEAWADGNISLEKHTELLNRLYHTTPQVKARQDAIEKLMQAQKKSDDALFDSLDVEHQLNMQVLEQTDLLALEGSLIGATDAERKKALANKRLDLQLEKEIADIKKRPISAAEQEAQIARARERRLDAEKNLNTEIANDAATKTLEEYNKIKDGLADSIVTALIEGGEVGSKQLRKLIEAELRKPITIIVKAAVDMLMGNSGTSNVKKAMDLYSSASSLFTVGSQVAAGTMSLANAGGTLFANATAGGIDALLATNAAYGTAAGSAGAGAAGSSGFAANAAAAGPYVLAAIVALNALGAFRTTKQVGGGISGTLGQGDISSYATMRKSGTLFRGPDYFRQDRGEFSGSDVLQASFAELKASTVTMAEAVGASSDSVKSFTKDIEISFDGLTDEQIQEKIATTFKGVNDELAALVLGAGATAEQLSSLYNNIMQQRYDLESKLLELQGDTIALRERERAKIYETNKGLFDQIKALEDKKIADEEAVKAMEKLTSVTTTIVDEINRLRGVNTSKSGLESQFAILTAQARAGDLNALSQLPEVTKGLEQIAASTAVNATDIIFARARLAQSLQDTLGYTGGFTASATTSMASIGSVSASGTAVSSNVTSASSNQELLAAMVIELQGLRAEVRADVSHNAKTAKILERANQDGETLSVSATIDGGVV